MKLNRILFFGVVGVFLASCQSKTAPKKEESASSEQIAGEIQKNLPAQSEAKVLPGKAVYEENCLSCHQSDGSGVPGMHPPLTPGSWVGKDPKELIAIMMKGLNGKIEVNGEVYNDLMPSHAQLSDQEIADVLTYIRASFGNNYNAVTPEMVKDARNGK